MKIARLGLSEGPRYALLDEESQEFILLADDPMFGEGRPTSHRISVDKARVISPMIPRSKVIGYGGTFYEGKAPASMDELFMFLKPNTSVIGPDDPIILPRHMLPVFHEVELAVVIGRVAKDILPERAPEAIFGYTVANDVTGTHAVNALAKGADTFCPIGPYIETELDPSRVSLVSRVNGEVRRQGNSADLAFSVAELVAYASQQFTLLPGDIILTGSPAGVGDISDGQTVEVEAEGIGILRNPVIAR